MTPRPAADRRTVPAIGAVLALIVVANLVRTVWIPGLWDFWWNVGFAASVGAVGAAAAMTAEEVGTARSTWASGARLGAIVFAAISGVVVLAALLPFGAEQAADERTAVSAGQMLLRVLVLIPIGTVVVEELVFRGVLLGLARRVASTMRAALAVSVVFGL